MVFRKIFLFLFFFPIYTIANIPIESHMHKEFQKFIQDFIPKISKKERQLNKLLWILETTGAPDAADLYSEMSSEYQLLFHDPERLKQLTAWKQSGEITDPVSKRKLDLLLLSFKENSFPEDIIKKITEKEADIMQIYATFRPSFEGKELSENEIRQILSTEINPEKRKQVWEKSKEIGKVLAPKVKEIVKLRNQGAKSLGYDNYFEMQLELQEVDKDWLFSTFDKLFNLSNDAYKDTLEEIEQFLQKRFSVSKNELGPWAWSEPFSQEDPIGSDQLDLMVKDKDVLEISKRFYDQMGVDTKDIVKKSDFYEKEGKNQHAFCVNIDRDGDVRTLNNIKPNIRWLETVLHELGHAIYEINYDKDLTWLLKAPPHMLTTEAIAMICGRQAYSKHFLRDIVEESREELLDFSEKSLKRRQHIFSRWALVMTYFEAQLYENPDQDLNKLWWDLVEKYQGVKRPKDREDKPDWASKYHISLAPVYYYSYLLGECLASLLQEEIYNLTKSKSLTSKEAKDLLVNKIFAPGNKYRWDIHIEKALNRPLTSDAWVKEFAK